MREIQSYYYESGAEAHQFETMPAHEERLRRQRERRERERKMRARSNARMLRAKKNHMISLLASILVLGLFFTAFIYLQNGITASMQNVSGMQKEISDLKAENAAIESRIATTAGLDRIRKKAMKKLGMKYATSKQIQYYSMTDEDYMSQYTESDK
ncbi:MAG: hypothetical protein K5889_08930 [Lachnospiraceae bacterium]|nr:hypothetical protein [Lachnospiraceae bacterium]